jgi:hypothetical protein
MAEPHPALDEVVDDLGGEDEGDLAIIEERSGRRRAGGCGS